MVRRVHTLLQQHYDENIGQVGLYFPENDQSLKRRKNFIPDLYLGLDTLVVLAQKTPFKLKCVVY